MFEDSGFFNLVVVPEILDEDEVEESEAVEDDSSDTDTPVRKRHSSRSEYSYLEEID
jgi:hypothetical protein